MTRKNREGDGGERPEDFEEMDLPEGVSLEDALRGFMQVDRDAVDRAEKREKKKHDDKK